MGDEGPLYQIPQTSTLQDIIFENEENNEEEAPNRFSNSSQGSINPD